MGLHGWNIGVYHPGIDAYGETQVTTPASQEQIRERIAAYAQTAAVAETVEIVSQPEADIAA